MKPTRAEYDLGRDAYGRAVTLRFERTYDGKDVFSIHIAAFNQRDEEQTIKGLTKTNLLELSRAAEDFPR